MVSAAPSRLKDLELNVKVFKLERDEAFEPKDAEPMDLNCFSTVLKYYSLKSSARIRFKFLMKLMVYDHSVRFFKLFL